jgi:hypothetical protein
MAKLLKQEITVKTPQVEYEIVEHWSDGTVTRRPAQPSEVEKCAERMAQLTKKR